MFPSDMPGLPSGWANFADWLDLVAALGGVVAVVLLIIWWRQQSRAWFRIVVGALLVALLLTILSLRLFVVPPHVAGCPRGCPGWSGYPLPVASIDMAGARHLAPIDVLLNWLLLWLLLLVAAMVWSLLAVGMQWWKRSLRVRVLIVLIMVILPWALLPRFLIPPHPQTSGEEARLANNARRSAEFTYRITGAWVQRLVLEDIRIYRGEEGEGLIASQGESAISQVCLRGYTYFFIPWRRYRITLDATGATAFSLEEVGLDGSCWEESSAELGTRNAE